MFVTTLANWESKDKFQSLAETESDIIFNNRFLVPKSTLVGCNHYTVYADSNRIVDAKQDNANNHHPREHNKDKNTPDNYKVTNDKKQNRLDLLKRELEEQILNIADYYKVSIEEAYMLVINNLITLTDLNVYGDKSRSS